MKMAGTRPGHDPQFFSKTHIFIFKTNIYIWMFLKILRLEPFFIWSNGLILLLSFRRLVEQNFGFLLHITLVGIPMHTVTHRNWG